MKKVISTTLFALFSLCSLGSVIAQQGSEQLKPKQTADEPKTQSTGPATAFSDNTSVSLSKPDSPEATTPLSAAAQKHYDSAMSLSEAGRFEEAIYAFKQSLKLRPEDPQTNFSLGMTYSKSKSYKEAFETFKKTVRLKPDWPEAHFRLGMMSYVLGKRNQSVDEYNKLLQLNSSLAKVLYRIIKDENAPTSMAEVVNANQPSQSLAGEATPSPEQSSTIANSSSNVEKVVPKSGSATSPGSINRDVGNKLTTPASVSPTTEVPVKTSASEQQQLTEIYRVGVGDVLDVRILNSVSTSRSTLFTVLGGGFIELPIAGGPISVVGLTTDDIRARIAAELKRRAVVDSSQVAVGVRQYVSHSVMITGLVASPGIRFLRREAVPLYVVLAESQLRNDAGGVVIMRAGTLGQSLDLQDPLAINVNVVSGDVITVTGRPQEFYYIAGRINYPGQKAFLPGITLLQAILAAGGPSRQNEKIVELSREGADGRLVTTPFNLKEIKAGRVEDPKLQPGDRIEVIR